MYSGIFSLARSPSTSSQPFATKSFELLPEAVAIPLPICWCVSWRSGLF
jgi:hypothetical protein